MNKEKSVGKSVEKKKGKMRFSDDELAVIKSAFSDNDELITVIRKSYLQFPLTDSEKLTLISTFSDNKPLQAVVSKTFNPQIEPDAPISQIVDLWMTIDIKDKDPEQAAIAIRSREILITYVKEALDGLFGNSEPTIKFEEFTKIEGKSDNELTMNLYTRNLLVTHLEQQLFQLIVLAGTKEETVEETKARLQRDSNK